MGIQRLEPGKSFQSMDHGICCMNTKENAVSTSKKVTRNVQHCMFGFCRHWFLNAVPAIGTHVSLKFIKEKFHLDDISVVEAAQALIGSIHMVTADLESIKLVEVGQPAKWSLCFLCFYILEMKKPQ